MPELMVLKKEHVLDMTLTVVYDGKGQYPYLTYNTHAGGERSRTEAAAMRKLEASVRFFRKNPDYARQLSDNPMNGQARRKDGVYT